MSFVCPSSILPDIHKHWLMTLTEPRLTASENSSSSPLPLSSLVGSPFTCLCELLRVLWLRQCLLPNCMNVFFTSDSLKQKRKPVSKKPNVGWNHAPHTADAQYGRHAYPWITLPRWSSVGNREAPVCVPARPLDHVLSKGFLGQCTLSQQMLPSPFHSPHLVGGLPNQGPTVSW